ncbi:MAG: AMP-binding protein, partial [Magnetococcales bacterium]|nr:AMP-binding protein [Magnetococcales bacterium]
SLGLPLVQGYGMTEASPVVSVNTPERNDPAGVGRPLPGVEVRLSGAGELQIRGATVMAGYWNQPGATRQVLGAGGWLRTGDQARVDEEGNLHLTGRIKEIIVMANGHKAPPAEVEAALAADPLISQVMVVGEARPYLSALVVLDGDRLAAAARGLGLDPARPESLREERLQQVILGQLGRRLKSLPTWAAVKRLSFLTEPWTVENGLLTPTLKPKRAAILARYAGQVEAMYR